MNKKIHIMIKSILLIISLIHIPLQEPFIEFLKIIRNHLGVQALPLKNYESIDMKKSLCYFDSPKMEIKAEKIENQKEIIPTKQFKKKRIYIYNTHQEEAYQDQGGVLEGAYYLQNLLEDKGYEVIVEDRKIKDYLNQHQLTYNESYEASYTYLTDTLKNQSFDLIIDFHRDSIDRSLCVLDKNNQKYAKMMFVIGGSNDNYEILKKHATSLHEQIDKIVPGIMRNIMTRDIAYYNQYVADEIVLLEVGSDANLYQEVQNSLHVLAQGIDAYFKEKSS